jgi:hypothetical protein
MLPLSSGLKSATFDSILLHLVPIRRPNRTLSIFQKNIGSLFNIYIFLYDEQAAKQNTMKSIL